MLGVVGFALLVGLAARVSSAEISKPESVKDLGVNDASRWTIFVPPGSEDTKITLTQSKVISPTGKPAIQVGTDQLVRWGIYSKWVDVQPGELLRLSAWVKADSAQANDSRSRGVLLRATLRTASNEDYAEGHFHVGTQGAVLGGGAKGSGGPPSMKRADVPSEWTKVEGVMAVPPGVTRIMFFVFGWWTTGNIYLSDAQMTKAEAGTPTSLESKDEMIGPIKIPSKEQQFHCGGLETFNPFKSIKSQDLTSSY